VLDFVHIEGFKSIVDQRVDLAQINVLIGANGSGKSNLIEAIGLLGAAASGSVEPETLRYRGVRPGLPDIYKSSFRGERHRRFITLSAKSAQGDFHVSLDNPIMQRRSKWRIHSEALSIKVNGEEKTVVGRNPRGIRLFGPTGTHEDLPTEVSDEMTLSRSQLLRWSDVPGAMTLIDDLTHFAIFSPNTPVLRGLSAEDVLREPIGLSGGALPLAYRSLTRDRAARDALSDFIGLIDWAQYVTVAPSGSLPISPAISTSDYSFRFIDKFMRSDRNILSGYDASEGAMYVIFMAVLALHPRTPAVLAIDNFDQSLHPRLVRELMERFCDNILETGRLQVFLTTHNPSTLDGLNIKDDRIRLLAVDRDQRGATIVRPIDLSFLKRRSSSTKLSLSQLWVMGRLGAVPNIF
jgi:predicted ATPase